MILGISTSPRVNGISSNAVQYILSKFDEDTKYITLANKKINGCISCLGCVKTNRCVVNDAFMEIQDLLISSQAIVLGVPNYYDLPNALAHSLLERLFCFRHNNAFLLKEKPIIYFSTGYSSDVVQNPVLKTIEYFVKSNKMKIVDSFLIGAFSQCYTCPISVSCSVGNVVKNHGYIDKITEDIFPPKFQEQKESLKKCDQAVELIKESLK